MTVFHFVIPPIVLNLVLFGLLFGPGTYGASFVRLVVLDAMAAGVAAILDFLARDVTRSSFVYVLSLHHHLLLFIHELICAGFFKISAMPLVISSAISFALPSYWN